MITKRQEAILKIIIDDYTKTAMPIASENIVRNHDLGVSSATIRNDVAALSDAGYIIHPHTSAGSVPSDEAYRYYVETLVNIEPISLPASVRSTIRTQLSEIERDVDEWTNVAAAVLSKLVGNLAIATFPAAKESRVKHIDLVQLQDFLVMLIVVMEQANLRRQLIRLVTPIEISQLEESTYRLRSNMMGLSRREIESQAMSLNPLEEQLVDATMLLLREEENATYRDHYVDGLRNLLGQPEFAENDRARAIVEGIEDGSLVQAILEETPDGGIVRVIIGQENRGDMLWPLSVVICQYGIPNQAVGAVGAVGPTRMQYPQTIAGVKFMSSAMSDLVESMHLG